MKLRLWGMSGLVLAGMLVASSARAGTVAWLDVGAKGAIGGNYLASPADAVSGVVAPFYDGAGGLGGGGGIFADVRFLNQHLGLELDLLVDRNKNWCTITYNDVVEVDYILRNTALRIPILLKGSILKGITRASLGVGPELIIGLNAETDAEVTSGNANVQAYKDNFSASKRTDVAMAWELAFAFAVRKVVVTLDLRFAYYLTFPKDYADRVTISDNFSRFDVQTGHTIDARVLLGAAYTFDFGPK